EVDGLCSIGKNDARALLLVQRLSNTPRGAKAIFLKRGMPDQGVVFGDEHIGMAITVQINELEVRVAQVTAQARCEGPKRLPALGLVMLVQARYGTVHNHDIGLPVAG